MRPPQAFETGEITVRGDQVASVFDGESGKISIGYQGALDFGALTEIDEDLPMPVCRENEYRAIPQVPPKRGGGARRGAARRLSRRLQLQEPFRLLPLQPALDLGTPYL